MKRSRNHICAGLPLLAALLVAVYPSAAEARDERVIPEFERVVIDEGPPPQPYYKMAGDVTGDGNAEIVIGGSSGPVVMYSQPDWEKTVIAEGGYDGVRGSLADINSNGVLDIVGANHAGVHPVVIWKNQLKSNQ